MVSLRTILIVILTWSFSVKGASKGEELGFEFVRFEADSFVMGSPESEPGRDTDETQVSVTLTHPFAIMTKEVTQRQWYEVMNNNPSRFSKGQYCTNHMIIDNGIEMCPEHPVEKVSWGDVQEFIRKLNEMEGNVGCGDERNYYSMPSGCYRLPTEAEWEYVARAGTQTPYSFGHSDGLDKYGRYRRNSNKQTHRVGTMAANKKGLHDVHGNVWEWTQDWYHEELTEGSDPLHTTPPTGYRVIRGGSWTDLAQHTRSANRYSINPDYWYHHVGFRLVRSEGKQL